MSDRRFEILEIPGGGAHATVCLARDPRTPAAAPVALKVLRLEFDGESVEAKRVRDEGVLLKAFDHPFIVKLHEQFTIDDREVLVMEWVEGPTLAAVVRKLGRIPVPVSFEIARRIAIAADYAYHLEFRGKALNLVHRDLNLSNVLISIRGDVKILDYGLAKAEFDGREADTLVSLQGTAGYVAPEGLHDQPCIDVYALGICLFFMLTGHLPVLSRQRIGHASGLSEQMSWMRKELQRQGEDPGPAEELVRWMCAYDAHKRPTMAEVVTRLSELLPTPVDLVAWADTNVHPIHMARLRIPPRAHASYDQLAFLEAPEPVDSKAVASADAELRAFLSRADWHTRLSELKRLLAAHPRWTAEPLLDLLAPLDQPWWKFHLRRPSVPATRAALRMLAHRPGHDVTARAVKLRSHRDRSVRELARKIAAGDDITEL
ncbi:MAG: serine/threonine-protein kinase [Myxococcota bacterium]